MKAFAGQNFPNSLIAKARLNSKIAQSEAFVGPNKAFINELKTQVKQAQALSFNCFWIVIKKNLISSKWGCA